jgi:hypothetical protein
MREGSKTEGLRVPVENTYTSNTLLPEGLAQAAIFARSALLGSEMRTKGYSLRSTRPY